MNFEDIYIFNQCLVMYFLKNCSNYIIQKQISVLVISVLFNGEFIVDTGHVVAFTPSLDYSITGMGSFKSTMLSGEGLVMKFRGNGTLYLQTRNVSSIASWLTPRLLG